MVLLELIGQFFTALLVGYLALTNSVADIITPYVGVPEVEAPVVEEIVEEPQAELEEEELETITTAYERGGAIPSILIENAAYQKAAVVAGSEEYLEATSSKSLNERVEDALVNIFCQHTTEDYLRTTTGTGFFIHENGVVLTNAHVAQFLLLEKAEEKVTDAKCTLRIGSPAVARYEVELLYISPLWINQHANLFTEEMPRGTGERDYALLYVTKSVDQTPLPRIFPALPFHTELMPRTAAGNEVLTAGYPAAAIYTEGADAVLIPGVASTTIGAMYTFGSNYADIFSVSGSAVGEQGASGGPIVNKDGEAIGLIVTKGNPEVEGERSLRALTLSYINRTIIEETGISLRDTMTGDLAFRGAVFNQALVPFLVGLLTDQIE